MTDIFADTTYGKLARAKINPTHPNFRLYVCGWLGKNNERQVMEAKGAVFREAKSGPRKGKLCIIVPGTERTAYITAAEMDAADKATAKAEGALCSGMKDITP